ncbi:hypothetical protein P691DRAFT_813342 [Macrolepiota fuliginosa MF-IS2]|uniref:Uncharacterized protein n=1 Tax=Macrolepiota fuliginosa MF-IS2 TaxID=1400762 RepID=A0A9P5WY92_9AGAR|nr:hypothetical protein P691DRAFT_813342 [Macrolepiota fuliginosa MF-IS2]
MQGIVLSPNLVELCMSASSDYDIFGSDEKVFSAIVEMACSRSVIRKDGNTGLRKLGLYFDRSVLNGLSLGRWPAYIEEGLKELTSKELEVGIGSVQDK